MKLRVPVLLFGFIMAIAGATLTNHPPASAAEAGQTHVTFFPHVTNDFCGPSLETFEQPDAGWFTGQSDGLRAEITGGQYRLAFTGSGTVWLVPAPVCERAQYHVAVDTHWSGQTGNFIGLLFAIDDARDRAYLFAVNTDARVWLVFELRDGGLDTVIAPTGHDAVLSGWAVNRLAVRRAGDTMILSVNGTPVGELRDSQPGGLVIAGVAAAAYTTQSAADARFDNFYWNFE